MKFTVQTLGCKTNQAESYKIEKILLEAGYKKADISEKPDICIINTCAVTSKADLQSRQLIKKFLKNNIRVIATGCYTELNQDTLLKRIPNLTMLTNNDKLNLIDLLLPKLDNVIESYYHPRHRPAVKVQDGCNNSCSYCVIPMARGRSRSLPLHEIFEEIRYYESLNYREIVLTGIHLGSYGRDFIQKITLAQLLKQILTLTKSVRFRLSSLEINEIDDELLEVLDERRICKHLHIPLQSGDDMILKSMNRAYTIKEYRKVLDNIFNRFDGIAVGTDIITGFPGEGEVSFINTKQILEEIPFSYLHIFPYSPRPGTNAFYLSEQVDEVTKKIRATILRKIGESKKLLYINQNIGKIKSVILESKTDSGFIATSDNYIKIYLPQDDTLKEGMLIDVLINVSKNFYATGLPLNNL
jgi:threonylcarbamoyladenosine tRNA methylthiotransferase MtaB